MRIDPAALRQRREDAGLSQVMLAERTGQPDDQLAPLTVSYISQLERGVKDNPSPWVVARLAKALGCKPSDLRNGAR